MSKLRGFFYGHFIKNEKNTIYAQANYNFKIFYFKSHIPLISLCKAHLIVKLCLSALNDGRETF